MTKPTGSIRKALSEYEAEHQFERMVLLPVEDRASLMPAIARWPSRGYRWFRSANIIDLSKVRLLRAQGKI
jgi:hypothetical protein